MITTADLKSQTRRDLAEMARQFGVPGWHSLRKDDLIAELRKVQRRARRKGSKPSSKSGSSKAVGKSSSEAAAKGGGRKPLAKGSGAKEASASKPSNLGKSGGKAGLAKSVEAKSGSPSTGPAPRSSSPRSSSRRATGASQNKSTGAAPPSSASSMRVQRKIRQQREVSERQKDLSTSVLVRGAAAKPAVAGKASAVHRDRVVLIVRDPYWLQASWEVTRSSVERARAAMAAHWHTAQPVLRLLKVGHGPSANAAEQLIRDIPIHGGVSNWYVDVEDPPARFRVAVGYLAGNGKFFSLCRSNIVETPTPGSCDPIDGHWQDIAEDYERIYALSGGHDASNNEDLREVFEERLQRRVASPSADGRYKTGAEFALSRQRDLPFQVDAELIIYGSTTPGTLVTVAGEPVRLSPDGTFTVRMELPDRRQVLPVVASSRDGFRQRTTVVAVERNTKVMESVVREDDH